MPGSAPLCSLRMKIFVPTTATASEKIPIAPRVLALEGKAWGFVDTSKVNADLFIEETQALIGQSQQPKSFITIRKEAPGFPLTAAQLDRLQSTCDVVVLCFGD
jgi:hypothetical protein